jgi:hypothetical protein
MNKKLSYMFLNSLPFVCHSLLFVPHQNPYQGTARYRIPKRLSSRFGINSMRGAPNRALLWFGTCFFALYHLKGTGRPEPIYVS